jgi:hypothetical protein
VHELGHDQPKATKELLDIAASGEEAFRVIFVQGDGKAAPDKGAGKGAKRSAKGGRMGPKWRPQQVTVTTICDDDNNDKEADDSDEENVAAAERDFKRQVQQPTYHFEKPLMVTCPNNEYPINNKVKDCSMMKNYMTTRALVKGKKPKGDTPGKATVPFPGEKAVMSIYDGLVPHESQHKLKLTSRAANAVCLATPEYLRWSESPITFNLIDHLDSIPKPRRFPLIVNPLVGTTRLTKAPVDGGSGLNLMYLYTFKGLGLIWDQLKNNSHPFYGVVLGKQFVPLG